MDTLQTHSNKLVVWNGLKKSSNYQTA